MKTVFQPAWWLPHAHLQTCWPFIFRKKIRLQTREERFELPDGDFLDLNWTLQQTEGPLVIVLHGLEGSIHSSYAGGILREIEKRGWRGLFVHFRSCSGELNRLRRIYHSGDTGDLSAVVAMVRQREPETPLAAVGYSLGGNVLLKWLGETGCHNPFRAAVAVSVPFQLSVAAERINRGLSRFYQWHFLRGLRKKLHRKFASSTDWTPPEFRKIRTMRAFDHLVTAPLHGFKSADDYYEKASCCIWLKKITVPTLLLQSRDDPFMTPAVLPTPHELSATVKLELTQRGGHVGFVSGRTPWRAEYWLERRVPDFLAGYFG